MPKIFLSPSNQTSNLYASGNTTEAEQMERVAKAAHAALTAKGYEVKTGTGYLADRIQLANSWGADVYVAIHSNAGGGSGAEAYYHPESEKGKKLASDTLSAVASISPNASRGLKQATGDYDFAETRLTKMPAALIEVEFHDNVSGANWIISNSSKIGQAIADGINRYFGTRAPNASPIINNPATLLQLGSFAAFKGGNVYKSSTDLTPARLATPNTGIISKIQPGAPHAYHIVSKDGKLYGWVDRSALVPAKTIYTVRNGDTLTSIARRFNSTVSSISQINSITNPNRIYIGQTLIIP